jgi:membrane protease YdiL (CAAX protease family)
LAVARPTRHIAFRTRPLQIGKAELLLWLLGAVAITVLVTYEPWWHAIESVMPDIRLGSVPRTTGLRHFIDLTFGLLLVAIHEEVLFRRVARAVFRPWGDRAAMIATSSVIFGLFHWWTGLLNMIVATLIGAFLMLLYRRAGALWPAVLAHYLIDFWAFL